MTAHVSKEKATLFDLPESPECGELLSFGVRLEFKKRWPFGVEVMLPSNSNFAVLERILNFNAKHIFQNVRGNERLKFTNKTTENAHLFIGQRAIFFKDAAMGVNGPKGPVNLEQRMICLEFFGKVFISHCASNPGAKVRARSVLLAPGASA